MKHSRVVILFAVVAAACGDNTPPKAEHPRPVPPGTKPAVPHTGDTAGVRSRRRRRRSPRCSSRRGSISPPTRSGFHLYDRGW